MLINGSEIIINCLLEQGVDTVFGYPGGAVLNIYDALYKHSDKIRHILTAHEQGAAHAADGYARSTGKTGVVFATSGPGATNLVTGLATAYMDSSPVVAITGNVASDLLGRDSFQEVDITGITMPVTKHNYIISDIRELAGTLREAFEIANTGRKGPVLIDIPKDITAEVTEYTKTAPPVPGPMKIAEPERLSEAAEIIKSAERPLIYAGGGVILSESAPVLREFAEKLQIPVAASMMGLGAMADGDPLFLGMIGMHGSIAANRAAHECDCLIVAGARFSDRVACNRDNFAKSAKIIHIDVDSAEFNKNVTAGLHILGDAGLVLSGISKLLPKAEHSGWLNSLDKHRRPGCGSGGENTLLPRDIIKAAARIFPDSVVVTDVGQHQMWTAQCYPFQNPRRLLTSGGLGTMGFGLGASVGAVCGNPEKRVILFTGDGSFHMNLNELTTLASYNLPVVVIIMNNQVLGMVRQWQKSFYGRRFSSTDPCRKTDFVKLAEAFGVTGLRIERFSEIEPVLIKAGEMNAPAVIDCRIPKDANVLPMIPPGGTVEETISSIDN